ncbi:hypothetical protein S83_043143 [Arachis hypogaea]
MAPCHTLLSFILTLTATLAAASPEKKNTFMVQVHHEAKLFIFPTHKHWYESSLASIINHATAAETTTTAASAAVLHTYDTVFHGFSAKLSPLEAQKLESLSHVIAVIPEQVCQLHTTRSLQFLGLKIADRAGLLKEMDFGSDLVNFSYSRSEPVMKNKATGNQGRGRYNNGRDQATTVVVLRRRKRGKRVGYSGDKVARKGGSLT